MCPQSHLTFSALPIFLKSAIGTTLILPHCSQRRVPLSCSSAYIVLTLTCITVFPCLLPRGHKLKRMTGRMRCIEGHACAGEDTKQNLCSARRARKLWTSVNAAGTRVARCNRESSLLSYATC